MRVGILGAGQLARMMVLNSKYLGIDFLLYCEDVTNTTNAHATENRVAFGHGDTNPTANVHVVGNAHITTTFSTGGNITSGGTYTGGGLMTTGGNIVIPNDGDVGSVGATDAMQISSAGIVTSETS